MLQGKRRVNHNKPLTSTVHWILPGGLEQSLWSNRSQQQTANKTVPGAVWAMLRSDIISLVKLQKSTSMAALFSGLRPLFGGAELDRKASVVHSKNQGKTYQFSCFNVAKAGVNKKNLICLPTLEALFNFCLLTAKCAWLWCLSSSSRICASIFSSGTLRTLPNQQKGVTQCFCTRYYF